MRELVLPSVNRPFVEALHQVADTAGTWSVIGGFAVWCHLGESHRPTLDIDTAAANEAHDTLVALGAPGDSDRRDQRAEKRGSDGLDVVRLLQTADWDVMTADSREVDGLAEVVAWAGNSVLVDHAARVSRLIQIHTDEVSPGPDVLREWGRLLAGL